MTESCATLLDFGRLIKRTIYIEIRPNAEYIVSFGTECSVLPKPEEQRTHKELRRTDAVHGRGPDLEKAQRNLVDKLNMWAGHCWLTFPPCYDLPCRYEIPQIIQQKEIAHG